MSGCGCKINTRRSSLSVTSSEPSGKLPGSALRQRMKARGRRRGLHNLLEGLTHEDIAKLVEISKTQTFNGSGDDKQQETIPTSPTDNSSTNESRLKDVDNVCEEKPASVGARTENVSTTPRRRLGCVRLMTRRNAVSYDDGSVVAADVLSSQVAAMEV